MIIDNFTKFIMVALSLALLLNGLSPWINPSQAVAVGITAVGEKEKNNCASKDKITTQTLEGVNDAKRLLGYIESSVNEIKLINVSIVRKLDDLNARSRQEKGENGVQKTGVFLELRNPSVSKF